MIKEQIIEFASQSPEFSQGIDVIEERLSRVAMVPEDLTEAIEMLETALQNPAMYAEMVQAAIADGLIDEGDAPAEFDPVFIISILLALYGLQDRGMAQGYARGGLTVAGRRLADQGQGGDSMLAHINPREAEVLRRMGGQGTVNPNTGLAEYKSLKRILKTAIPIATMIFMPALAPGIGASMGFTGMGAAIAGSAVVGAGTAALTGGDPLRGAVMGGISGGIGNVAGDFVNDNMLGEALTSNQAAVLGSGLVGGAAGAISGEGFTQGALQGAGGQLFKDYVGTASSNPAFQAGVNQTGNMLTAGYKPQEAIAGGATAGLFTAGDNMFSKKSPSTEVVNQYTKPNPNQADMPGSMGMVTNYKPPEPMSGLAGLGEKAMNWAGDNKFSATGLGLAAIGALEEVPEDVGQAVSEMSPDQQEYFNRDLVSWDWDSIRADANRANLSLTEYMAGNFNDVTSGKYNTKPTGMYRGGSMGMNQGGALSQASRYVRGGGTGRSDEIPAYLSDGEFVVDAETVSMLGDGSSKAGAAALDTMRKNIRSHKGKVLAQGQFSPNAKSPLQYLKRGMA